MFIFVVVKGRMLDFCNKEYYLYIVLLFFTSIACNFRCASYFHDSNVMFSLSTVFAVSPPPPQHPPPHTHPHPHTHTPPTAYIKE